MHSADIIELVRQAGTMRPQDMEGMGLPPYSLWMLYQRGLLMRVGRGLYAAPGDDPAEYRHMLHAVRRAPRAVVCLHSALYFHHLITEEPDKVWLAIDRKARKPKILSPPVRIVCFSGTALTDGIEEHAFEGTLLRVYGPAKTVADCFKYRHKIGLDVALRALRTGWDTHRLTMDDLWAYAQVCRVANVMRPYLESLV